MNDIETDKLIEIFNSKFPKKIYNENSFRKGTKYIHHISPEMFETIIKEYIEYLNDTGDVCKTPENFIYMGYYKNNFKVLANNYNANKKVNVSNYNNYNYEDDNLTEAQRYYKKHQWWYENEAPRFAKLYPEWKYNKYIPQVKKCFYFAPRFIRNEKGEHMYDTNKCQVYVPDDDFAVINFEKFDKQKQTKLLIHLEWNLLTFKEKEEFIYSIPKEKQIKTEPFFNRATGEYEYYIPFDKMYYKTINKDYDYAETTTENKQIL